MFAQALALAIALAAEPAHRGRGADDSACIARGVCSASEVAAEIRRTGQLTGPLRVEQDVDLSLLRPPPSARGITFREVEFRGRLRGTPKAPLRLVNGSICILSLASPGDRWPEAVELSSVRVARLLFKRGTFAKGFSCIGCEVCRATFTEARFEGEATFTDTSFGAAPPAATCDEGPPASCLRADFSDATFGLVARFDRARFGAGGSFDGSEFKGNARFPGTAAGGVLSFIGARLRGDAEFRGGELDELVFGMEGPASYESSELGKRADFRDATFAGPVRFDSTAFRGETTFQRAKVLGDVISFRGIISSQGVDLRGLELSHRGARLLLDSAGADAVRVDWGTHGDAVLRGLEPSPATTDAPTDTRGQPVDAVGDRARALQALSVRLSDGGDKHASRRVAFEAQRWRRAASPCTEGWAACAAGQLEWWLWTVPTRNGSDPAFLVSALAGLWLAAVIVAFVRAPLRLRARSKGSALPIWCTASPEAVSARDRDAPWFVRSGAVLRFATALVLKLGTPGTRCVVPQSRGGARALSTFLLAAWFASWILLAALAALVAASFPGLAFLKLGG